LNAVCPDGFQYSFVDEEFVVGREFGLVSKSPVDLGERESKLFTFNKYGCVPGKAAVQMKPKVFKMLLLRDLNIIYMGWWERCASSSERHVERFSFISFHTPSLGKSLAMIKFLSLMSLPFFLAL
jgi:hypothetical protein